VNYLTGHGYPPVPAELVAHHFGARFVTDVCGPVRCVAPHRFQEDGVSDALTYADQRIGPDGTQVPLPQRIAEVLDPHGPDSPNAKARSRWEPHLCAAAARVEQRLAGPTGRGS